MYVHSNPVPHRTHKKSRTGCRSCKARRVKCDEKKPVCSKCAIHFSNITACDYGPPPDDKKTAIPKDGARSSLLKIEAQIFLGGKEVSNPTAQGGAIACMLPQERILPLPSSNISNNKQESILGHCGCPCHHPGFTNMLLDAVFGICRICGNSPLLSSRTQTCTPVISDSALMAGRVDPFSVLPEESSSPRVHFLIYHWVNTLALFPTTIHSQYCTNPAWLSAAIANPSLFKVTLFASSIHVVGLYGQKESPESLFYRAQTVKVLNEALDDPALALADETLATVLLLTHILAIIGEPIEVETHSKGLQQMINLRGGIENYVLDGVFLHMLCTTNHLTAVFSESPSLHPQSLPYTNAFKYTKPDRPRTMPESPALKDFAISSGFHSVMVNLLYDMGYLYAVVDVFTRCFLPELRSAFEELVESIKRYV